MPTWCWTRRSPSGDRKNTAFMSTLVTYGRGRGLVTGTGMHTQIGLIAEMIQSYEDEATPLQKKLDQLAKMLGIVCLAICGIIFIYGLIRDTHLGTHLDQGFLAYLTGREEGYRRSLHDRGEPGHRGGSRRAARRS